MNTGDGITMSTEARFFRIKILETNSRLVFFILYANDVACGQLSMTHDEYDTFCHILREGCTYAGATVRMPSKDSNEL